MSDSNQGDAVMSASKWILITCFVVASTSACDDPPCPGGLIPGPHGSCITPGEGGVDDGGMSDAASCSPEVCGNDVDEDCDAKLDEDCPCTAPMPETCNARDDDCNGAFDDGPAAASCEAVDHATSGCSGGACYAMCAAGFADCDRTYETGCEAELASDVLNCGECGQTCGWDCAGSAGCDDAVQIAVGSKASCVLRESGTVVCWGDGSDGGLGDGTYGTRAAPAPVSGLTNVIALGGNRGTFCALQAGGQLSCWGLRAHGNAFSAPTLIAMVPGGLSIDVSDHPSGGANVCAIFRTPGTSVRGVRCGFSFQSQTTDAAIRDPAAVACGYVHYCALRPDGEVWCWGGDDGSGALGRSAESGAPPGAVEGLEIEAKYVSAGHFVSCAAGAHSVYCWGTGFGQRPVRRPGLPDDCEIVDLNIDCVACADGRAVCWEAGVAQVVEGAADIARFGSGGGAITREGTPLVSFRGNEPERAIAPRPSR